MADTITTTSETPGDRKAPRPKRILSEKELEARRRNSKRSTGPRTDQGKSISRFNNLKHGLRAEQVILPGEDEEAYQKRLQSWTEEMAPETEQEQFLVERAVVQSWRLTRAVVVENS